MWSDKAIEVRRLVHEGTVLQQQLKGLLHHAERLSNKIRAENKKGRNGNGLCKDLIETHRKAIMISKEMRSLSRQIRSKLGSSPTN